MKNYFKIVKVIRRGNQKLPLSDAWPVCVFESCINNYKSLKAGVFKIKYVAAITVQLFLTSLRTQAASLSVLHTFGELTNLTGINPKAQVVQGPDGTLYGTAGENQTPVAGVVFKVQPDGSQYTILRLVILPGTNGTLGGMVLTNNTLYGTAYNDASPGIIFKVNTDGADFSVLHDFSRDGTNQGIDPQGTLLLSDNILYGTTKSGGAASRGMIFALNTDGTGFTNLYNFGLSTLANYYQNGSLILADGMLYGTTLGGEVVEDYYENQPYGSIFALSTNGIGFTNIYVFSGSDGEGPNPGLVLLNHTLYGTTQAGGPDYQNAGTIFAVQTDGTGFTNLYNAFDTFYIGGPAAGLLLKNGVLYGTSQGGFDGMGSIFKLNIDGTGFTNLYDFSFFYAASYLPSTNADGGVPLAPLTISGNTLFGTASIGGTGACGTIFKIDTDGSNFTVINTFTPAYGINDGLQPQGGLALSSNTLFGTTASTVFRVNTDGSGFADLFNQGSQGNVVFSNNWIYESSPQAVFAVDQNGIVPDGSGSYLGWATIYYGLDKAVGGPTLSGGTIYGSQAGGPSYDFNNRIHYDGGSLFSVNVDGSDFTILHSFTNGSNGGSPFANLVVSGGLLYGTTAGFQGSDQFGNFIDAPGTLFVIGTNGSGFRVLHNFANDAPYGDVVLSGNTLYGTTHSGGAGYGTVFAINVNGGGFKDLYEFSNLDGANPSAGLLLSNNTLYGTTANGGSFNAGTVFSVKTDGTGFVSLYSFANVLDGANPVGDLILSSNTLYGTTLNGGNFGTGGTVFALKLQSDAIPLNMHLAQSGLVLNWSDPGFSLQAAPTPGGVYTNVPGAASPYTNAVADSQKFFRLKSN